VPYQRDKQINTLAKSRPKAPSAPQIACKITEESIKSGGTKGSRRAAQNHEKAPGPPQLSQNNG